MIVRTHSKVTVLTFSLFGKPIKEITNHVQTVNKLRLRLEIVLAKIISASEESVNMKCEVFVIVHHLFRCGVIHTFSLSNIEHRV